MPTTDLLNEYHQALWCGMSAVAGESAAPPLPESDDQGVGLIARRRTVPLPGEPAEGRRDRRPAVRKTFPSCRSRPRRRSSSPMSAPTRGKYGNRQLLLNSEALKQLLYGPIDGPPRNTTQIGQPG